MTDLDIPGVAVGIVFDQQVLLSNSYGFANTTSSIPVSGNTLFRIGGLTRLFTTLAAFAIRETGAITLDAPLASLLPQFSIVNPYPTQNVTLRALLGDISGFPRNAPPGCEPYSCTLTTEQVLQLIKDFELSLINPPFLLPSRSDLAFSLVGRALEKIPGQTTYENAVATYITSKLSMPDTVFTLTSDQETRAAAGYENGGAISEYDLGWLRPWGGLYSTLDDMVKLMLALNFVDKNGAPNANKILSTQTLREMELPLFMNPDTKTGQGTPFQMIYLKNKVARTLGGAIAGFGSHMILIPNLRIGIVALGNTEADMSTFTTPAAVLLAPLIERILASSTPAPTAAPDPSQYLGTYVGLNSKGETGTLVVSADSRKVLKVVDSRYPATVYYELNYSGPFNGGQRFSVAWKGDPLFLSCILQFNNGVNGEFFDFSGLNQGHYEAFIFQGEDYLKVG